MISKQRKEVILEKLAAKGQVVGSVLKSPKGAEAYLRSKLKTMPWSKIDKRTYQSTGTGTYQPRHLRDVFPVVGPKEKARLEKAPSLFTKSRS